MRCPKFWRGSVAGSDRTVHAAQRTQARRRQLRGRYVIVDILLDSTRPAERLAYFDPPCKPGSTELVHK
jgi:3-(3-hydroxy-phenyl)propionate hydroxylase